MTETSVKRLGGVDEVLLFFSSGALDGPGLVLLMPEEVEAAASKSKHCGGRSTEVSSHEV